MQRGKTARLRRPSRASGASAKDSAESDPAVSVAGKVQRVQLPDRFVRPVTEDLVRVERFTFPIVFVLLVLVFGSVIAAGVPLVLGAAGVVVSLAVLAVLGRYTDISIFALNTASMIGSAMTSQSEKSRSRAQKDAPWRA